MTQAQVIAALRELERPATVKEIQAIVHCSLPTIRDALMRLERWGEVEVEKIPCKTGGCIGLWRARE
jgi:predicted transcriptional regulator